VEGKKERNLTTGEDLRQEEGKYAEGARGEAVEIHETAERRTEDGEKIGRTGPREQEEGSGWLDARGGEPSGNQGDHLV